EDTGHARLRGEYPRELVERVETVDGAQRVRAVGGLRQLDRRDQWRDRGRVEVGSERLPAALRGAAVGYVELELERGFEREPAPHEWRERKTEQEQHRDRALHHAPRDRAPERTRPIGRLRRSRPEQRRAREPQELGREREDRRERDRGADREPGPRV